MFPHPTRLRRATFSRKREKGRAAAHRGVTEVWFYHLQSQPLDRALPMLVEKGVERGWRVIVQTVDDLRVKALDDLLWTYRPDSFLPHGTTREKHAELQPVVITAGADNPNDAAMRVYVEDAPVELDAMTSSYERVILIFDGGSDEAVAAARQHWSRLKTQGFALSYWQQTEDGRWSRRN